jgi:hypothetical protein
MRLVAIENIFKDTGVLSQGPVLTEPRDELDSERLQASICQQADALSEDKRQTHLP